MVAPAAVAKAADAAAEVRGAARAVKSAAPTPTIKPARGIMLGLVGSLSIVAAANLANQRTVAAGEIIGVAFVYVLIGAVAEFNPKFGRALSYLAALAILLARGDDAFKSLNRLLGARSPRRRPARTSTRRIEK